MKRQLPHTHSPTFIQKWNSLSLNLRMIVGASLVLATFILLTGLTLDRAFRESAQSARQERLLGQLYLLIAAAEVDDSGQLSMPPTLAEAKFNLPGSGLYGYILDRKAKPVWQSSSTLNHSILFNQPLAGGQQRFKQITNPSGVDFYVASMGINWSTSRKHYSFTFNVMEDSSAFNTQINQYRQSLWGGLGIMSLLLLIGQTLLLRWGLQPLRQVVNELSAIESGQQQRIERSYPLEIKRLTDHLNQFLIHERAQQKRYRDALADLAHSLKTPLAIMRNDLAAPVIAPDLADTLTEEVIKMDKIVEYQLQRASLSGRSVLTTPVSLGEVTAKIVNSLQKVYRDKAITVHTAIDPALCFRGDQHDLMELLGNVLDNAFKWSHHTIQIIAQQTEQHFVIRIEDDGPGIAADQAETILKRGMRADQTVPGHGIGLAIVRDILEAYQGNIEIHRSQLGGAAMTLTLPSVKEK